MKDLTKYLLWALMAISIVLGILFFITIAGADADAPSKELYSSVGMMLNWSYILILIAAVAALLFSVIGMATNVSKAMPALIGVAGLILVFAIAYYAFSTGTQVFDLEGKLLADEGTSKLVEAGIFTTYILIGLAVLSILFTSVSKLIK